MSGTKFSQLTRNSSIWRFFCMQGEFCTVLTTKKPSRESYAPFSPPRSQAGQTVYRTQGRDQASQHNNTPGPTGVKRAEGAGAPRRGAGGRQQEHSQTNFAHNFPRSFFETTQKHCNSNDANSMFEQAAGELRAELMSGSRARIGKSRMQFPHDTNQHKLKNRRISTIRFQYLKYSQGNCMRN